MIEPTSGPRRLTFGFVKAASLALKEQDIEAIVCGGCARDTLLGKPVKDIDFVLMKYISKDDLEFCLRKAGFTNVHTYGDDGYIDETNPRSRDLEFVMVGEYTVQIDGISVTYSCDFLSYSFEFERPRQVVDTFDCSLNRAWFHVDYEDGFTYIFSDNFPIAGSDTAPNVFAVDVDEDRMQYITDKFPEFKHTTKEG